jgi:hypothetical protein
LPTRCQPRSSPAWTGLGTPARRTKSKPNWAWFRSLVALLGIGILSVAGLSGWLAQLIDRETVFLLGLVIPGISALGVLLTWSESSERRPLDWRILGGGMGFGITVMAVALGDLLFGQEVVFALSMLVI